MVGKSYQGYNMVVLSYKHGYHFSLGDSPQAPYWIERDRVHFNVHGYMSIRQCINFLCIPYLTVCTSSTENAYYINVKFLCAIYVRISCMCINFHITYRYSNVSVRVMP